MIDDKSLFAAIASSDETAFKALFERYRPAVYTAVLQWVHDGAVAEDLTQDVFIKFWEGRHLLANVTYPKSYIYKTTFNYTKNYLRRTVLNTKAIKAIGQSQDSHSNSTMELLEAKEVEQRIAAAVGQLSQQKQTIYNLSKKVGKSYQEIAIYLKISPETVRSHLYESMKFIRQYLKSGLIIGFFIFLRSIF